MTSAIVTLQEYSAQWPIKFEHEKNRLVSVLGNYVQGGIEHVGSTAIPGMVAKPVIDIMVGVKSLKESKSAIELLKQLGYHYWPYKEEVMHWFCKPSDEFRTHHLHLIPFESELWFERLSFRDKLIQNKALADQYASLKRMLAEQHKNDRETYTLKKGPFIRRVLEQV